MSSDKKNKEDLRIEDIHRIFSQAVPKAKLPVEFSHTYVEEKRKLEINPEHVKPGELYIYEVKEWMGFRKTVWAIMNVGGKFIKCVRLK